MALLDQLKSLVEDAPPTYVFELSEAGIAHARRGKTHPEVGFNPFPSPVLQVSPVKENVFNAELLGAHVASLIPENGNGRKRREAALILPDYCTRIALLDFDSFPKEANDQLALVRFRMKKTVPFDMDAAAVSFQTRKGAGKTTEVLVAAAANEIVSKYEAPFRVAGYQTGFVTTSMLATLDLLPKAGLQVCAKIGGQTMSVAVCDGRQPKLVRCVEMDNFGADEVMGVLYPTFAYAEDELEQRPARMFTCGFDRLDAEVLAACAAEMGLPFEQLVSRWGATDEFNAGLLGWLQAQEDSE
jgi:type IV pilus assembly protein PilM